MAFCIITDSASDIPECVKKEYGLYVMPTPVTIEGTDYFDGETIFPDKFYDIQASGKDIKTYHISQYMFEEHFRPFAERGDEVLYICFSTGIAGTFNAANLAYQALKEEFPEFTMTIIDSKCASIGYGLVTERLLRMQRNKAPKELLIEAAHFFCEHMEHAVTVFGLEYLFKGGRLSRTSFLAGTVLDIKPIIIVDENGSLKAVEKVRGWKKAQKRILDMVGEKGKNLENQVVGACFGTDKEAFAFLKEQLRERYHVKDILETQVGCAIGAHTGPGILGIVFLNDTREAYEPYLK
ncbi:MAG TPA: DegV family protein [Candidatus Acetatifactor stercoripullorum]|uniref:DegV family protein n=1 Tax=Candidatus Acetatifactor stercoripullorum TaxID=2838414 RepID=A0A9D1UCH7_9FIRM|nr:DegV family protein [Candidatus Acetatifactor stercoripullorum]HIW81405.1 DegV family protein [Candidatus Acetatifactor stercoripullorum]